MLKMLNGFFGAVDEGHRSVLLQLDISAAFTTVAWEEEFISYFAADDDLVYCCNVSELVCCLGGSGNNYACDWRLLIASPQTSLKVVLLNNGTEYGSVGSIFNAA